MTTDLKAETIKISELQLDPANARLHDDENIIAITSSLRRFGQIKPIVVTSENIVLAGNGTVEAARNLGWSTIKIVRTPSDWSSSQAMAYAIADNRTAELAEWNSEVLVSQLIDLDEAGWDLKELGFPDVPLRDVDEDQTLPGSKSDSVHLATCPRCGHTWNTKEIEIAE